MKISPSLGQGMRLRTKWGVIMAQTKSSSSPRSSDLPRLNSWAGIADEMDYVLKSIGEPNFNDKRFRKCTIGELNLLHHLSGLEFKHSSKYLSKS